MSRSERWDIFCTVVDNYGDIGVTWRLARQLVGEFDKAVCLWVDDLQALQRIWPAVDPLHDEQVVAGVRIRRWDEAHLPGDDAAVVIEAFACHLPETQLPALVASTPVPVWLNLEYLSAEDWVADCHGLPSFHPLLPLTKYFFFPGFADRTGGLLRERGLLAQRRAFQDDPEERLTFLAGLGVEVAEGVRVVSLFSYESPAIAGWLAELAHADKSTLCLIPEGRALPQVAGWLNEPMLSAGDRHVRGSLTVVVLPFLQQDDYDRLLWSCDLNVVRGEDSFVRAQWAGRPFIWHIYPQDEAVHLRKLEAFLALHTHAMPLALAESVRLAMLAWSGEGAIGPAWMALESQWLAWQQACTAWCDQLAGSPDLATSLVEFCAAHQQPS